MGGAGDDELKRRVRDRGSAALLAACRLRRCASPCRARTALRLGLPVLGQPAVGDLGLLGELALVLALCLGLVHAWARIAAPAPAFLGLELQRAQLAAGERRAPEGVVLFTREQVPEEHAELSG